MGYVEAGKVQARHGRQAGGPCRLDIDAEGCALGVEPAVGGAAEAADGRVLEGGLANAVAADAVGEDVRHYLDHPVVELQIAANIPCHKPGYRI